MIRRPLQFETLVGTYTWPRYALEYDPTQSLILAMIDLPGADYAFDQMGGAPAIKGVATHTIRFMLVGTPADIDAEIDEMRRVCYLGARGELVLQGDDGSLRKCTARITAMPQITLGTRDRQRAPVILAFIQLSDFYGESEAEGTVDITADPQDVEIVTPGNAIVHSGRITIHGPFDELLLTNTTLNIPGTTSPYVFNTSRVATAGQWLEIDVGAYSVMFSADGGSSWANDAGNVQWQNGQIGLFAFGPGVNSIRVGGAAGGVMDFQVPGAFV